MRRILLYVLTVLLGGSLYGAEPVRIDFFYEPGCRDCERIEKDVLPEVGRQFPGACEIHRYDVGVETNFLYLLQLEQTLGYTAPERAYLIVNRQTVFGPAVQPQELCALVAHLVKQDATAPVPETVSPGLAQSRFSRFTLPAVAVAGLLDGINPCAISTLVFFMSLLAVAKVRNRQLILLGVSFCFASFVTYLAIGFGLLRFFHLFSGFTALRSAAEWIMAAVLLVLAALSLRDAIRYRKSGRADDVTLQLSAGMKNRIHGVMRRGLGNTSILLGGLLIGTAVTMLESVCTGQVYVPTLVLILKDSGFSELRAWSLLLLYNVLFIAPLAIIFIATYFGLRTETLLRWSRRNVFPSKLLLALFFAAMALLIVLL